MIIIALLILITNIIYTRFYTDDFKKDITVEEFNNYIKTNKIVIVGSKTCPDFKRLKKVLSYINLQFKEIDLNSNLNMRQHISLTYNNKEFPVVFVCGEYIGDYHDFYKRYHLDTFFTDMLYKTLALRPVNFSRFNIVCG
ncbi:hypothetical protein CWI38_2143p0020 [Hamiltosporidium tvaerminnensis]|uniref:Glutaredoxin domain-containing protein n=1 Tax=Hamiltosporidium tvaerminnensis TaxID=1176355 RepID=A0A4Q9LMJ0_9MICR|nr:hypothetical protein CWI38_2143p0020 [Hamiltosporidium tvaerminnensis]